MAVRRINNTFSIIYLKENTKSKLARLRPDGKTGVKPFMLYIDNEISGLVMSFIKGSSSIDILYIILSTGS